MTSLLLKALAAAAVMSAAAVAHAVVPPFDPGGDGGGGGGGGGGVVVPPVVLPSLLPGASLSFSGTRSNSATSTDTFEFIVGPGFTPGTGLVATFQVPGSLSLTGFSAGLYADNGAAPFGAFSQSGGATDAIVYAGSAPLTSGLIYELRVTATGNPSGSYTAMVAAVPEPHEWAMMLAGLGVVGWVARRRQADPASRAAIATQEGD